jgi:hypothetical protein
MMRQGRDYISKRRKVAGVSLKEVYYQQILFMAASLITGGDCMLNIVSCSLCSGCKKATTSLCHRGSSWAQFRHIRCLPALRYSAWDPVSAYHEPGKFVQPMGCSPSGCPSLDSPTSSLGRLSTIPNRLNDPFKPLLKGFSMPFLDRA